MKNIFFALLLISGCVFAQNPSPYPNGIKAPKVDTYASGLLDVNGGLNINSTTKGLLIPRMTTTQRDAISSPAMFTQIANTSLGVFQYYDGSNWVSFGGVGTFQSIYDNSGGDITDGTNTSGFSPSGFYTVGDSGTFQAGSGALTISGSGGSEIQLGCISDVPYINIVNNIGGYFKQYGQEEFYTLDSHPPKLTGDYTPAYSATLNGGTKTFADTEGNIDLTVSGGFQNPAVEDLNMDGYNIEQVNILAAAVANIATLNVNGDAQTGSNSGDVTKSGESYISLSGQAITANPVNLSGTNVTGVLPITSGGTGLNSLGTSLQYIRVNTLGNALEYATLAIGSGTVTNVSSANADIAVATGTTTPVLTLNSGTGANQIVKRDGSGNLNATTVTTNANLIGDVISTGNATTYNNSLPVAKGGTGATANTGTGNNVLATSPTLVTPNLGTPSAIVLTNGTGLPESGVTNLVSDLAAKQATITGAATTVTTSNLTVNRAVISNGSGKLAVSATTDTELGYVSGARSAIQTQIDSRFAMSAGAGTAVTGVTTNTLLNAILIPANTTQVGSYFDVSSIITKVLSGAGSSATFTIRLNTTATAGGTLLATFTATSPAWQKFARTFTVTSGGLLGFNSATNSVDDGISNAAASTLTAGWNSAVNQYITFDVNPTGSGDSFTSQGARISGAK